MLYYILKFKLFRVWDLQPYAVIYYNYEIVHLMLEGV